MSKCSECKFCDYKADVYPCNECYPENHNNFVDKDKTINFEVCCESMETMAQVIDIAKVGWTKEQILEWLKSEVKE